MTRRILLALAFAATLAAQTFIQMTDPQFGMYTENKGFAAGDHLSIEFRGGHGLTA